jgi:single-stranded-DNA-specific exonuclease
LAERGTAQVISVDCGIASLAEADTAERLGLELIITDHHEMADRLPRAAAIVHPRLPGHNYPFAGLCGAGVAFKLVWHVFQLMSQSKRVTERLRSYLLSAIGLAAVGTVADVVPLLDENRVLVKHGLSALKARPTVGLEALMKISGLDKKPHLSSDDIAFMLAPRLNAAGRLGQAGLGVELLTTDSHSRAEELAKYLEELNVRRTSLERGILLAAKSQINEQTDPAGQPAFVLSQRGWHPGVIGIVAGRICDEYHRPTIVMAVDELGVKPATGSGRSIPGFNLNQALHHCREFLVTHGGHAAAAGLRVEEKRIPEFREAFCEYVAGELSPDDCQPRLTIDAEAALPQLTLRTVKQLEQLSPFGQDHPRPTLCARGVRLGAEPKRMGRGERHLSVMLEQHQVRLRAVAFHQGQWAEELQQHNGEVDIAYRPVLNEFNGRRSVEIHLVDWKPAGSTADEMQATSAAPRSGPSCTV